MKGSLFALLGGVFITLQGVANTSISQDVGVWQATTVTQLTGFLLALLILICLRDKSWRNVKQVKPLYLIGGTFGAIVVVSNITAIQKIGVTVTISALLIAQLLLTFVIDSKGWFGLVKQKMKLPQFIGMGMMIAGVVMLTF
ncbi:DMT family transporter [Guptibacillus hwajinpoensis]|uniref:Transporter family-2 protein n=1 Tax=Guptibacillus hwajinpoensis TaxID=208199 RepID=A0ABU0JVI9_9BACL|nr:DMT family transporter [Alkalihalobacillus hemicentroti]MDQ0481117.1 transporter family-2 protein [Alkalihalobacillus hemicentroti]